MNSLIRNTSSKVIVLLGLLLLPTLSLFAQKKLTVGFQLGPNMGFPFYADQSGIYNQFGGSWGVNILLLERKNFIVESGFYKYTIYFDKRLTSNFQSSSSFQCKGPVIPLRFQRRINILKNKLFISPSLGICWMSNQPVQHFKSYTDLNDN